jgi:hypothetical protein
MVSILELADMGASPRLLTDTIQSVFDIGDLLMLSRREQITTLATAGLVVGGNAFAGTEPEVPAGELWYVWNYTVVASPGVGAAVEFLPTYREASTAWAIGSYQACAASQEVRAFMDRPMWAKAGGRFGLAVKSVTGAVTANGFINISRFRI